MTSERYRIGIDAYVYFVTYSIIEWLPVFVSEAACRIVTDSLNYCQTNLGLRINAYVIMPTHLHAIVFDHRFDNVQLQHSLTEFRKFTGRSLCDYCAQRMPRCFDDTLHEASTADRHRRFWQPSRHPEAVESEKFWRQKLDYLHENPCRKGLVRRAAHWRFSSAAFYISDGQEVCDVPVSAIDWS
jgi:REP element-mobilizing transposase RayT